MTNNQEVLVQNIDAIKLTALDNLVFTEINNFMADHGAHNFNSVYVSNEIKSELEKLRLNIVDQLAEDFIKLVNQTERIDDPESFVKSYCVLDGKNLAKRLVTRFDWSKVETQIRENIIVDIKTEYFQSASPNIQPVIREQLSNEYHGLSIFNFDKKDVEPLVDKINQLSNEQEKSNNLSLSEIQSEINDRCDELINTDDIYKDAIDLAQENYGLNVNQSHTDLGDPIIKNRINKSVQTAVRKGKDAIKELSKDPQILSDIGLDDEGAPYVDDFLCHQIDDYNGVAYRAIHNSLNNEDLTDIIDELKDAYIQWISNTNWEGGKIEESQAKKVINDEYPGDHIFLIDEDILDDLVNEILA